MRRIRRRLWDNLATVSILGMLAVLALGFVALQKSRVESCQRTYESFPLMFKPFFPPDQKKWTDAQNTNWNKLQDRADGLGAQCREQINVYLFK